MQTLEQFDQAIQDIQDKIGNAQTAIANQKEFIDSLKQELVSLDTEVSSLDDITKVEACIKKCRERREEIEIEQKQAEIRLRAYNKTLQNNQKELEDAIESRRVALKSEYETQIVSRLKTINELRAQIASEVAELDNLICRADKECYTSKGSKTDPNNTPFNPQGTRLGKIIALPYVAYNTNRKQLQFHLYRDRFDYFLKQLKNSGDENNWVF